MTSKAIKIQKTTFDNFLCNFDGMNELRVQAFAKLFNAGHNFVEGDRLLFTRACYDKHGLNVVWAVDLEIRYECCLETVILDVEYA